METINLVWHEINVQLESATFSHILCAALHVWKSGCEITEANYIFLGCSIPTDRFNASGWHWVLTYAQNVTGYSKSSTWFGGHYNVSLSNSTDRVGGIFVLLEVSEYVLQHTI